MRFVRVAAAATSLLLLGAVTSIGSAGAATTGVGTSKASTTVVGVALGENGALLDVRLLGDDAGSTVDSKSEAFSKLTAVHATSTVVDGVDGNPLNLSVGLVETRQPGGKAEETYSSVDLANPGVPVPAGLGDIISGNLNLAKLTSQADTAGAKSTLTGSLTNTKVAGALLDAQAVSSTLASSSTATEATSTRSVDVDAITVLDLGAVLDGLNIHLTDLTPEIVSDLLEGLDVTLPGLDADATLDETVTAVNQKLEEIQGLINSSVGIADGTAGTIIDDLGLGEVIPQSEVDAITGTAVEQANLLYDTLQSTLGELLATALTTLDQTSLLKLEGVDVSVTTKAADTLDNSSAEVTGKIGAVTVGNLSLPAIDLLETADVVNGKIDEVNETVNGVLSLVTDGAVDLSGLVDVEVLQRSRSVETVDGYNVAKAGLTGLTATITPPAELDALIDAIQQHTVDGESVSALLDGYGVDVPELSLAMTELEATLGAGIEALQDGATVNVVQVLGESHFRPQVGTPGTGTNDPLAETGANSGRVAAVGFLLVAFGLGLSRWFRMPAPAWVRRRF